MRYWFLFITTFAASFFLSLSVASAQSHSLELLLLKNNLIAKEELPDSEPQTKIYWDNSFHLQFPEKDYELKVSSFLQARYLYNDFDHNRDTSSFEIPRARLRVVSSIFHDTVRAYVMPDFVTADQKNRRTPALLDAFVEWDYLPSSRVTFGQYKTGISRQWVASDQYLELPDRSLVSSFFDNGRQAGASVSQGFADHRYSSSLSIFNGTSDGEGLNHPATDTLPIGIFTLRANPLGEIDPFSEGDLNYSTQPGLSLGSAFLFGRKNQKFTDSTDTADLFTANADATLKYRGASIALEGYYSTFKSDGVPDSAPHGAYVQVGYFFIPKKWELVGRYGYLDCDDGEAQGACAGLQSISQTTAGVNYHIDGHHLKLQLAYDFQQRDAMLSSEKNTQAQRGLFQVSWWY